MTLRKSGVNFIRIPMSFRIPLTGVANQAGAVTFVDSFPIGFWASLERAFFQVAAAGAGAGATQTFRVRKGGATGTILATITATLANQTLGAVIAATVTETNTSELRPNDTITITKDAGGTVFTTFDANLVLVFRQAPQTRR